MNPMRLSIYLFTISTAALILFLFASCKGPTGPDGTDSFLTDSLPPQIDWISPEPGLFTTDTIILQARVTDDQELWRMVFYIAGFERDGILIDSAESIYAHTWITTNYPEGPYPIMGRAWDVKRNMTSTPVTLIEIEHPDE